ncbi:SDR family NAD(P)-dependent oxidoreductase [Haloarchaeobius iranensis]|uniref:NAD(P)-dependent dehydrogenase, short-chain alcohol dehydrogenase family n=1 Tax=Haloarchaeobius iranensis TaxID=996166 RepID=A0A1G9TLW2_9EURY|nr:SDR family NAD(P)-dependent oxidoreductase [Haloarchaeobius iranensis]SDM48528.1 NAD(P)-dependent dehydrogenase, short-chain alcohol dehydrogenase family [Haloarchaeobius iranensis]
MTRPEAIAGVSGVDLAGRTVLVTGATSGVGRETALALARMGARVFVHGRDREAGRAVATALDDLGADPVFFRADFANPESPVDLAAAVGEHTDRLDVLVNNAGAYVDEPRRSDGVELTFRVNHLAPFALTRALSESGAFAEGARVVTVASAVHPRADAGDLSREAVTSVGDYDGLQAYARSKLANVLFTRELARREPDLRANCCHPGLVPGSGLWRDASLPIRAGVGLLSVLPAPVLERVADSPRSAAATSVFLAAGEYAESGAYFSDCEPTTPSPAARDDELAGALWELSEDLAA